MIDGLLTVILPLLAFWLLGLKQNTNNLEHLINAFF
jgi:hypothetical protein